MDERYPILSCIDSPADLHELSTVEMDTLAAEIRARMTEVVGETGGHLASNLGVVEITLALHRIYDFSSDRLVFDVSHQCYVHKLITGRRDRFHTLRQQEGVTGFTNPAESLYDEFVAGHASTSISSAVGLATGYRLAGVDRKVVALIGDGAIGGGMCFEAMNHAGHVKEDVLVVLNDNDMAIAETVGAFSTYLTELRSNPITQRLREDIHNVLHKIPFIGGSLDWLQEHILGAIKGVIEPGHIFSAMGFNYFGPIDGHDISSLEREFSDLRQLPGPKLLHVVTRKGYGFNAAANDPESYHSAVPFEIKGSGQVVRKGHSVKSYSSIFAEGLNECAKEDGSIVAITAAMPTGTGIREFQKEFPERFIDVGICEAHSVTFAGALAKTGIKPVVAIYSTFLQRGYDQMFHDVSLQGDLPIIFAMDRSGLVGSDGPTHHGVFDIAFLRHLPHMKLMAPRDGEELKMMLRFALRHGGLFAVRYPRGGPPENIFSKPPAMLELGKAEILREGRDATILAYGRMVENAFLAADLSAREGIETGVVNMRFVKPLDEKAIRNAAATTGVLLTVEDHALAGGFGSAVAEFVVDDGLDCALTRLGIPDVYIEHAKVPKLDAMLGLDPEGISARIVQAVRNSNRKGASGVR